MTSALFSPFTLRGLTLKNRIVVSPMCQYSAEDGVPTDWHLAHLVMLAGSGAGQVTIEMTDVTREGRITPGCLGLYSDACEAALKRVLAAARRYGNAAIAIQLAHAGRKGSSSVPWKGGAPLKPEEGAWETMSASSIPFAPNWPAPREMTAADIKATIAAFVAATQRAARLGLDAVEIHAAHGYLLHQFLSGLSNKRSDEFGGSYEKRMRFPLMVAEAVRKAWPQDKPMGMRITTNEWAEGGLTPDDAVTFAKAVKALGVDYLCCSGGGNLPTPPPFAPGFMVEYAAKVKREAGIPTRAIGMILTPKQAEAIVAEGKADLVAMARAFLDDPHWAWHAAEVLGATPTVPPQYGRAVSAVWPGAKIIRPPAA